jgi:organic radical activating enzyme
VSTLPVSEAFGVVFQGEGPYSGHPCCFLRLGHCNLHCPQCDTPYTWDTTRYDLAETCPPWTEDEIFGALEKFPVDLLVISGGEPLMWQKSEVFQRVIRGVRKRVHVETNGTIVPSAKTLLCVEHFSVSPKLSAMGGADPEKRRIKPVAIGEFARLSEVGAACFKFVCSTPEHVGEVERFAAYHGIDAPAVWIMPEGAEAASMLATHRVIADAVLKAGFRTTTRLHLLLGTR